ncbi:MAG: H(+)-transporting two-sector ATPase [Puniceicoccaceae bacterium 5H]|nr:MAG: H(+)-transporting two-sector ATPase [Puniceicoccaceae bacterium 5H]
MQETQGSGDTAPGRTGKERIRRFLAPIVTTLPVLGLLAVVYLIGWPHTTQVESFMITLTRGIALLYGVLFLAHWALSERAPETEPLQRWIFPSLAVLIVLSSLLEGTVSHWVHGEVHQLSVRLVLLVLATLQQLLAFALRFATWIPVFEKSFLRRLNPGTILFSTFLLLILFGTLLLKLPNATTGAISWLDALFTSTSAVCVTGLIVVDTATAFTPLGQAIILLLIQLGAFGIVTLTFFLAVVTGQGFSVASRVFLKDVLNLENLRNLGWSLFFLITLTFAIEGIGCIALAQVWAQPGLPIENLWWVALFHSISAFCNAGFSLFSAGLADPRAATHYPVQAIIMVLIVLGGIGFPVMMEFINRARKGFKGAKKRFSVHFRLVVGTTLILLVGGTLLLYLSEVQATPTGAAAPAWVSLFNAVTARTAGFNITDMGLLSSAATAIIILLMFIGGSPGGFAGGIKTTTFALAMLNLRRILLARKDVELFGRRIDEVLCNRAFAVLLLSFFWIFSATTLILFLQPEFTLLDTLFETVSAFSTVGLTRGITGDLSQASKVIIIVTMFVGRIGVMNFFFSLLIVPPRERRLRLPRERIIID